MVRHERAQEVGGLLDGRPLGGRAQQRVLVVAAGRGRVGGAVAGTVTQVLNGYALASLRVVRGTEKGFRWVTSLSFAWRVLQ